MPNENAAWYNYSTREYDYIDTPTTDAQAMLYLPQSAVAGGMYNCYRQLGLGIFEAMANVLAASIGKECPCPVEAS